MKSSTIKSTMHTLALFILTLIVMSDAQAQYTGLGENYMINGDFALEDSLWTTEGSTGTVTYKDTLKFIDVLDGSPWDLQSYQKLSAKQISALATGGKWELTFDAMTPDSAKNFHVYFGENGGSWSRYWNTDYGKGTGDVAVDGEWKTYTLSHEVKETWENMKLGFEVGDQASDLYMDNISLRKVENNIVFNGDFALSDSAWVMDNGGGADSIYVGNGELRFKGLPADKPIYTIQAYQEFTSGSDGINNKDSIYVGPYKVSFDAKVAEGTHDIHLFIGENGGSWARYLSPDPGGDGMFTIDTEMKTYVREFTVTEVWDKMKIGFEVGSAANDLLTIDNVTLTRVPLTVPPPDAPVIAVTSENGINTITVTDNGADEYNVYFADSAFTDAKFATKIASLSTETGLSTTQHINHPLPSMVKSYDAYFGVVAKNKSGNSEMTTKMVKATTALLPNYILQMSENAFNTVFDSLQADVVPSAETLASFFPTDYKPFTITSDAKVVSGVKPTDDNDLSGKFWVGYETSSGSDYLVIYAEIMDDVLVQGQWDAAKEEANGPGAWNFDAWEGNFSTYEITDPLVGSTVNSMGAGTSDYQIRGGVTDNADKSGLVPYINAKNNGALDGLVPNSITAAEVTDGMYRTLTLLSTLELANLETTNTHIEFPGEDEVSAIPFMLSLNDADEAGCSGCRETQVTWSNTATDGNFWQTPSQWEIVGLVGSNMVEAVSNEYDNTDTPLEYSLDQNYPNPFNPSTNIQFTLAATSNVTLEVYNVLGQKVATLLQSQKMNAGNHTQVFDASSLASGMYVYRISTPSFVQSRTMMLIK